MKLFRTVIAALLLLCSTTMNAYDFKVDGIYYNITGANSVEVTFTGSTYMYNNYTGSIAIPENVTYNGLAFNVISIGRHAFRNSKITAVTIPNSVKVIGESSFLDCTNLTEVIIPEGVEVIENTAFENCTSITNIEISSTVNLIGSWAFANCTAIETITSYIPAENINGVFHDTSSLENVDTRNAIMYVPLGAKNAYARAVNWWTDNIIELVPENDGKCGENAYWKLDQEGRVMRIFGIGDMYNYYHWDVPRFGYSIENIIIEEGITSIGDYIFNDCTELISIEIPSTLSSIGECAIYSHNLSHIISHIPVNKLQGLYINDWAFSIDETNCTLTVPYGAKEAYASDYNWILFTNIEELPFDLTVTAAGYATLFLDYTAEIPAELELYTANTIDGNYLMMQEVTGILPANTGVIVKGKEGKYTFERSSEAPSAIAGNLFRGSVEDVYITPAKEAKYYVLSMKDGVVGMYEDALSGGTFKNNANKAYLVLGEKNLGIYDEEVDTEDPGMQLSNSYYFDFSGTTAIEPIINEVEDNIYYDLSGRRVENPTRGIYILNGKKILVK